jgi:hypothetical protein
MLLVYGPMSSYHPCREREGVRVRGWRGDAIGVWPDVVAPPLHREGGCESERVARHPCHRHLAGVRFLQQIIQTAVARRGNNWKGVEYIYMVVEARIWS